MIFTKAGSGASSQFILSGLITNNMIIASNTTPKVLLADMSWWTMIKNSPPKIYQDYELLCPTIFYAEIYHDIKSANKRFKTPYEVISILPWQLLVKNELEGKEILQDSITPFHLNAEQNMDSEEEYIKQKSQNIIKTFDKHDEQTFQSGKVSSLKHLNDWGNFGNIRHQNLTWDQFFGKIKGLSQDSLLEKLIPIIEQQPNKNRNRIALENMLNQSKEKYPINTFKKACIMAKSILRDNFVEVCNVMLISEFERVRIKFEKEKTEPQKEMAEFERKILEGVIETSEFDNTHWKNNRDYLLSNPKAYSTRFPYTSYTLYLLIAFIIYQKENSHNDKIKSRTTLRDFEYLFYTYFRNVLFVSMDKQHKTYIEESGILKSRKHGSFVYIPHKNDDPVKYDMGMKYIQYGTLY